MKPNARMVCIVDKEFWLGFPGDSPEKHEVVKILSVNENPNHPGVFGYTLEGYDPSWVFISIAFKPTDDEFATNLLEEIKEEINQDNLVPA